METTAAPPASPAAIGPPADLVLSGRVGINDVGELRDTALALLERGADVTVDCEQVEHFDLAAFQVLLALRRDLAVNQHHLQLSNPGPALAQLLTLAGWHAAVPAGGSICP